MYLIVTPTGSYGANAHNVCMVGNDKFLPIERCAFELACRLIHFGFLTFDSRIKCIKMVKDTFHLDLKIAKDSVEAAMRLNVTQIEHVLGPQTDEVDLFVFNCT